MYLSEISAVLLIMSKNCTVGMYLDVKGSFFFKLGIVIDSAELFILMLV